MAKASKTPAAPATELTDINVVWVGNSETTDGAVATLWITEAQLAPIKDDGLLAIHHASSLFEHKVKDRPRVLFGVYTARGVLDADGRLSKLATASVKWTGQMSTSPNSTLPVEAKATIKAIEIKRQAAREYEKAGKRDEVREHLEPLHRMWLQTNAAGRRALEVMVLHALRGGGL